MTENGNKYPSLTLLGGPEHGNVFSFLVATGQQIDFLISFDQLQITFIFKYNIFKTTGNGMIGCSEIHRLQPVTEFRNTSFHGKSNEVSQGLGMLFTVHCNMEKNKPVT